MTSQEAIESQTVYARLEDGRTYNSQNGSKNFVPTLHRCTVCLNLFNRPVHKESHKSMGNGTCHKCGKVHNEPVQGYLPDTQDMLVNLGGHPVLIINTNGQLKMSKNGKVQIGTRWCEFQEMTRSEVFTLIVSNRRNPIEVRDMGGK